jgi:hypothetical protein
MKDTVMSRGKQQIHVGVQLRCSNEAAHRHVPVRPVILCF